MHTPKRTSKKWSRQQRTLNFKNSTHHMKEKKKDSQIIDDITKTSSDELEKMAKEAIKKFKSLNQ